MDKHVPSAQEEFEHQQALNRLLGLAAHRAGGLIRYTPADEEELQALYGEPTPVLVGVDATGPFAMVAPLELLEDRGWPLMAEAMEVDEHSAREFLRGVIDGLRRVRARAALLERRRADRRN
jgi:hypothetical protein